MRHNRCCRQGSVIRALYVVHHGLATILMLAAWPCWAQDKAAFDAAAAFGAREDVADLTLSPDGRSVAFIAPTTGQGSVLLTQDLAPGSKAKVALVASGKPERMQRCRWVSNDRLVCTLYGLVPGPVNTYAGLLPMERVVAVDRSGGNLQILSTSSNEYSRGYALWGGTIVDWLPDQDGKVLMSRLYIPDEHTGSRVGNKKEGLGVDLLDTRTLASTVVEEPGSSTNEYFSDGRGTVRIAGKSLKPRAQGYDSGIIGYFYRKQGSRAWLPLAEFNWVDRSGFEPLAVDHDRDIAYGLKKKDGRLALYSVSLDGSLSEQLIYARDDVDVDGLYRIGRRNRVVGVVYSTDKTTTHFLDPDIENVVTSLAHALPNKPALWLAATSVDEQIMLVFAARDDDPGVYYVFDRRTKQLQTFLVARGKLEGVKLAMARPIGYPAADGVMIPGYLTLPPGREEAKGLPAIVMPHGGPSSRDHWGFDYLAQFFASRGYAVLQPNYRGSTGYGDDWLHVNAFRSWRLAIGDVLDAGHWLVAQGIADPGKLAIFGWSYGGYAALQSAATEPGLFKAVIAVAPVTDLEALKEEERHRSDFRVLSEAIGDGPFIREGSPEKNADKIKAPVLMFHGALDINVLIRHSRRMSEQLTKAGVRNELVTWKDLDHQLEDSEARAQLLRRSDEFLRQTLGVN